MSAVIDRRSLAGPAVKAHYLSDNRPCALQAQANEAVCLGYLPSLKWKGERCTVRDRAGEDLPLAPVK